MTRTMKLNYESPRTRHPLEAITPEASIPKFMEYGFGACSVLQREKNSLEYTERWIPLRTHSASHQEGASPLEVDMYLSQNGIDFRDTPEPIDAHSAEDWDALAGMDDGDPHLLDIEEIEQLEQFVA